jgi:8-oxo-dGTP diphosphatase
VHDREGPTPSGAPGGGLVGPQLAVGAAVVDDGRLLTVRRARPPAKGRWTLPGGRVEAGERVADAVAREVAEETGLRVEAGALLGWTEHLDDEHHYVILDFRARLLAPGTPVAGDDAADVAWLTRSELRAAGPTEGLVEFLEERGVRLRP